jgi:hypothetical protein
MLEIIIFGELAQGPGNSHFSLLLPELVACSAQSTRENGRKTFFF